VPLAKSSCKVYSLCNLSRLQLPPPQLAGHSVHRVQLTSEDPPKRQAERGHSFSVSPPHAPRLSSVSLTSLSPDFQILGTPPPTPVADAPTSMGTHLRGYNNLCPNKNTPTPCKESSPQAGALLPVIRVMAPAPLRSAAGQGSPGRSPGSPCSRSRTSSPVSHHDVHLPGDGSALLAMAWAHFERQQAPSHTHDISDMSSGSTAVQMGVPRAALRACSPPLSKKVDASGRSRGSGIFLDPPTPPSSSKQPRPRARFFRGSRSILGLKPKTSPGDVRAGRFGGGPLAATAADVAIPRLGGCVLRMGVMLTLPGAPGVGAYSKSAAPLLSPQVDLRSRGKGEGARPATTAYSTSPSRSSPVISAPSQPAGATSPGMARAQRTLAHASC
jgi:hypothetical protein